jgi:hypothetical protein
MSDIHEYTSVHCPFEQVPAYLDKFFSLHGARDGIGAMFELSAPFGEINLERHAVVSILPLKGFPGYERFSIGWEPMGGGPFPKFEGTVSVSEESLGYSRLDLDGSYDPPGGALGAVFDAAVGNRIAHQTGRLLLEQVRDAVERDYAHDNGLPPPRRGDVRSIEDA